MAGPLHGVRVIDLTMLLPGPLCSQHLGDMGADIIKIENPRVPDLTRYASMLAPGSEASPEADGNSSNSGSPKKESHMFQMLNRNKRSVTLNINREDGKEILFKLLETADILLEGFRPGKMEELGIGYSQLKGRFPRLIYCAISGYGASGPLRDFAGHDGNYIAGAGVMDLTGSDRPVVPGVQIADIAGGTLIALSGILAALYSREKNGKGQFVDVSMMDGAFSMIPLQAAEYAETSRSPNRKNLPLSGALPNYNVYECKDGKFVMLGSLEERFFKSFLRAAGREDLMVHFKPDGFDQLKSELQKLFLSRTRDEWKPLFENTECCLSPVRSVAEAFENPQLLERGMVIESSSGPRIGSPFHFTETPSQPDRLPPPAHGGNTAEILAEIGYGAESLSELKKKRVI